MAAALNDESYPRPPKVGPPTKRIPRHLHTRLPVLGGRLPQPPAPTAANSLHPLLEESKGEPSGSGWPHKPVSFTPRNLRLASLLETVGKRANLLLGRAPSDTPTFDHVKQALTRLRTAFDPVALETLRHYAACKVEPHAVDLEEVVALALRAPDHWTAALFDQMLFENLRFGPSDGLCSDHETEEEEEVNSSTVWPHDSASETPCRGDFRRFRHTLLTRSIDDGASGEPRPPIPSEVGGTGSLRAPRVPRCAFSPSRPRPLPLPVESDSDKPTPSEALEAAKPFVPLSHPPACPPLPGAPLPWSPQPPSSQRPMPHPPGTASRAGRPPPPRGVEATSATTWTRRPTLFGRLRRVAGKLAPPRAHPPTIPPSILLPPFPPQDMPLRHRLHCPQLATRASPPFPFLESFATRRPSVRGRATCVVPICRSISAGVHRHRCGARSSSRMFLLSFTPAPNPDLSHAGARLV
eukprot:GGOE01005883.1.p1 GENE.GGOE01005883.1~~GGOE01005883.1.p1  ORF type:complete len:522 (-),score=38.05 GGOE01005883.1:353-1753(-)